jgi:DNA-directed RNA polymerase specialized sigma24 family protein
MPAALLDEDLYRRIFRALIAVGLSADQAGDALHDAYERAMREAELPQRLEGWLFVVAQRRWRRQRIRDLLFRPLNAARAHTASPIESGEVLAEVRRLPCASGRCLSLGTYWV